MEDRLDVIGDEVDILGAGVMGLTIKCAKCHSHKYDPIPQRDYYRLLDVFKGAYDEHDWLLPNHLGNGPKVVETRYLPYVTPGATPGQLMEEQKGREARNRALDQEIEALKTELEEKAKPVKEKLLNQKLNSFPASLREDLRRMLVTPPDKRSSVEKYLSEKFEESLKSEPEELQEFDAGYRSCLLYTSPSPRDRQKSRMPSSA